MALDAKDQSTKHAIVGHRCRGVWEDTTNGISLLRAENRKQQAMRLAQAFAAIQQTVNDIDYTGY